MNLLLILFIVLYASSKTDVQKATAVAESIRKGFNASSTIIATAQSPTSAQTSSTAIAETGDYSAFYDQLVALIQQSGLQNQVTVVATTNDVVITLKDTALYPSGSADLSPVAHNLMNSIGHLLLQVQFGLVMVEGYTDTDPIHNSQFADNLQLSTERANNVYRVLLGSGVSQDKLASIGWGETHPVAPNTTSANKAQNRRVVLTILRSTNGLTPQQIIAAQDLLNQPAFSVSAASQAAAASASSSATASTASSSSSKAASSKASTSSKASSGKSSSSKATKTSATSHSTS